MKLVTRELGWQIAGSQIVAGVTLELGSPGITAIIGPNGAGKTTLLNLIAGLLKPNHGTVKLDDQDVSRMPARERARRIAVVEQLPQTNLDLATRQVVELGRIPHRGRWFGRDDTETAKVEAAMATTKIRELSERRWQTLSGGERQRAQLARALVQEPELLLLDEPTNHLDLRHQLDLLDIVAQLPISTVAVLHDLDLAAAFCTDLVVISEGRIAGHGPPADVLTPELVQDVFGVRVQVSDTDRLRVSWQADAC